MVSNLLRHEIFGSDAPADPGAYVFHYTNLASAVSIATGRTLRLSRLADMNDPREFKAPEAMTVQFEGSRPPRAITDAAIAELQETRLDVRVASFTTDAALGNADSLTRCDGRGYARPNLWAHYANRHRGVCFVFDREALESAVAAQFGGDAVAGPVVYVQEPDFSDWGRYLVVDEVTRLGASAAVEAHLAQYRGMMFFEKNADWAPEREWRCCVFHQLPGASSEIQLPAGLVRGLVVGVDMPESDLVGVEAVASAFGVADAIGHVYVHQLNVLDVYPVNTATSPWRYLTRPELRSWGYL